MPTQQDMQISLDDARFFCEKISQIVRGQPEHEQNLEEVRRARVEKQRGRPTKVKRTPRKPK